MKNPSHASLEPLLVKLDELGHYAPVIEEESPEGARFRRSLARVQTLLDDVIVDLVLHELEVGV